MRLTNQHIYDFISALPGGNVVQYSRLLSVSATRLNKFLDETTLGEKLVKAGKVMLPMKGTAPKWAISSSKRGVLTGDSIPTTSGLNAIVSRLPVQYQEDVKFMFRTIVDMTSGNVRFEETVESITGPYRELAMTNLALTSEIQAKQALLDNAADTLRQFQEHSERIMRLTSGQSESAPAVSDANA